jgi:ATP-dependent RNA helicase RhlE
MICSPRDEKYFDAVEKLTEIEIPRIDNPVKAAPKPARKDTKVEDAAAKADAPKADAPQQDTAPQKQQQQRKKSGGRKQREPEVIGMGDDAPAFIRLSFEERRKAS